MRKLVYTFLLLTAGFVLSSILFTNTAYAQACCVPGTCKMNPTCGACCPAPIGACQDHCVHISNKETGNSDNPNTTIGHVTDEFNKHRQWMVEIFFKDSTAGDPPGLLAAMQLMTEQLTTIGIQQVQIIGGFFDAKHQLETQRLFQQLTARAHKDYHPSESLCEFGTVTRSLSASFRNTDLTAAALSKRSLDRQLLSKDTVGRRGVDSDQESRLVQFIKKYCNKLDNSKNLDLLCTKSENKTELFNKDVNYTTTIDSPLTLDLDFSKDGAAKETEDEKAIFALMANLFSHKLMPMVAEAKLLTDDEKPNFAGAAKDYLDSRALTAKRSVAGNSFASIAALKSKGDPEAQPFIYALVEEMGGDAMNATEIEKLIGKQPSYYAQMEVLTKKLYQNPRFYADLYDKPANVMRKDVAVQAATLMQKRDLYRSYLRSEMVLAVMLEAALIEEQEKITNEVNRVKGK